MKSSRIVSYIIILLFVVIIIAPANASITIPPGTSSAYIQTTGPLGRLGVGDYRTNTAGDNLPHIVSVFVPCTPNETYVFELFDPSVNPNGNPPGVGLDGVTPRVLDEARIDVPPTQPTTPNTAFWDNTNFTLRRPNGTVVATQTYTFNQFDQAWTTLATVVVPAVPIAGVNCGEFELETTVGNGTAAVGVNNDENGWRFRLLGGVDPDGAGPLLETFDPTVGLDGVAGTGDEAWIGNQFVSYQHTNCLAPADAQLFYWFSEFGDTNMFMINFDLDGVAPTWVYTSPSGDAIAGTISNDSRWNSGLTPRPGFAQLPTADPPADLIGDAIAAPETGQWSLTACILANNQYSFEVPGKRVFLTPLELPDVQIAKTDGVTTVTSPGSTTYTITITNTGTGAAMPVAGPEVVDQLPAGMTFTSCAVNPPLVGACNHAGGGTINFELTAQTASGAYLPSPVSAPNNTGTLTVTAAIDPGLVGGTSLTNTATVNYTDIYGNRHPPKQATDVNTIPALPAISLVKTISNPAPLLGDTVTFTYIVTNIGNVRLDPVTVNDVPQGAVTNLTPTALNPGQSATGTIVYTFVAGDFPTHTNTATATGIPPAGPPVTDTDIVTTPSDQADLELDKSVSPATVPVGGTATFRIVVNNRGPDNATGIEISDVLPVGLVYVSDIPSVGTYNNVTGIWTLGALANGALATLDITVTVPATGTYVNTAQVSDMDQFDVDSTPGNSVPGEDDQDNALLRTNTAPPPPPLPPGSRNVPSPVIALVDPFITKTVNPPFALPGELVIWTIVVSNPGTIPVTNVNISDNMPNEVEILSVDAVGGSGGFAGQTVTISAAVLNPGDSIRVTVRTQVRLNVALPFIVDNEACFSASNANGSCAIATLLSVQHLPSTGESPLSHLRLPLFTLTLGLLCVLMIGLWEIIHTAPVKSQP